MATDLMGGDFVPLGTFVKVFQHFFFITTGRVLLASLRGGQTGLHNKALSGQVSVVPELKKDEQVAGG